MADYYRKLYPKPIYLYCKPLPCSVSLTSTEFFHGDPKEQTPNLEHIIRYRGPGQNCTKTKLHEGTKLHAGTKLNEDKIARRRFCTKTNLHEVTNLHEGTKLHKDKFALRVNFAPATNLHRESNLHGCQICTG